MKRIKSMIVAAAAALILSACSPGQLSGPLTIKGLHLGMTSAELNEAAEANGWSITNLIRAAEGRSTGSFMAGDAYYGQVIIDDEMGVIYFQLNTEAFDAGDLSYQAFVESLQAAYPIGELQQTHEFGGCGRWEGRGPAGEVVSTTNCGRWSIYVAIGAEQSQATFN